ncbi:MAG TPA: Gfo/Idh/MocA family oxidoreductase [Planctomycetota bacterium]|nr:Gfo/Idh/MocA family oxidoreductase [Planctomycetota bacterium]
MPKVRVAILGCGGMAGEHARRFKGNKDVEIVALCDVTEDLCQKFIERNLKDYPTKPAIFTDRKKMYAQSKLDGVAIITPHTMHFDHGKEALEAGCHVLMEKPMVTQADQAYALAELAKKTKKIVTIGYNTPCTPAMNWVRDAIRSKKFGKLELVSGYLSQNWMKAVAGTWRQKPELSGGGQAYDSGAHILNSLCWTVEGNVAEVFAFVDNHGTPVDINSSINVRFENGVIASIVVSGNCMAAGASMHFVFEDGRIDVDGWGGGWIKAYDAKGEVKVDLKGESNTPNDNFIDAVLGRAEPRTSPANGIVQSELMDAIYESQRTGKPAKPKRTAAKG